MSSARPNRTFPRILRSASFRLTLIYAALFVVSACVLFATVFVIAGGLVAVLVAHAEFEYRQVEPVALHGIGDPTPHRELITGKVQRTELAGICRDVSPAGDPAVQRGVLVSDA